MYPLSSTKSSMPSCNVAYARASLPYCRRNCESLLHLSPCAEVGVRLRSITEGSCSSKAIGHIRAKVLQDPLSSQFKFLCPVAIHVAEMAVASHDLQIFGAC